MVIKDKNDDNIAKSEHRSVKHSENIFTLTYLDYFVQSKFVLSQSSIFLENQNVLLIT